MYTTVIYIIFERGTKIIWIFWFSNKALNI